MGTPAEGRKTPRHVVLVNGFNIIGRGKSYNEFLSVESAVKAKLVRPGDHAGGVWIHGTSLGFEYYTIGTDTSHIGYKRGRRQVSGTDLIGQCLWKAKDLIGDSPNGMILLFCDGENGADFVGAQKFACKVPVHTFSMGRDTYDQVLRAIAARFHGGTFNTLTESPWKSTPVSQLFDRILNNCEEAPASYAAGSTREGLDLVCVLDRTCYRTSDAILVATCFLAEKLTPVDRLSIVVYEEAVFTHPLRPITPADQEHLKFTLGSALNYTSFKGSRSDLKGGIQTALDVINNRVHGVGRPAAIFLMCNGRQLPTSKPGRVISNVPIHTFGFGHDADEQMLRSIASNSAGGTFATMPIGNSKSAERTHVPVPTGDRNIYKTVQMPLDAIFSTLIRNQSKSIAGRTPRHVVIVNGFNIIGLGKSYKEVMSVERAVIAKLILPGDRAGGVWIHGESLGFVDYTIGMDQSNIGYKSGRHQVSGTNLIAHCLSKAHDLIGGSPNGMILLLCDGANGPDFVGAQDIVCKVPVHTFSMGRDTYDQVLRAMAERSPGGTFNPLKESPWCSTPVSKMFDRILNNYEEEPSSYADGRSTREGLDLVCVLERACYKSTADIVTGLCLVMEKLTPVDRLSIVIYEDVAFMYPLRSITPGDKEHIKFVVKSTMSPPDLEGSRSDLRGGLQTALDIINTRVHGVGRRSAIFLMCNGKQLPTIKPNTRVVSNVPIHTFGFGYGADAQMLRTIASNSVGGTFSLVPSGDSNISLTVQPSLEAIFNTLMENKSKSNAGKEGAVTSVVAPATSAIRPIAVAPATKAISTIAMDDDEKPPAPNSGSNTAGLVTMNRPMYGKKNVALAADSVTVVVELTAASSPAVREGLDLVAVLDVSSGMDNDKKARMKNAMEFVIKKLTPTDRLCIVTFADGATRHSPLRCVTAAAQTDLISILDGLKEPGGDSTIKAGMDTALDVLSCRKHKKGRTANIFLLSTGVQSAHGDARLVDVGSVAVFTFGIGKDTDNVVLSTIARKSAGGTFSTVKDGAELTTPFAELLAGTLTVVAQDVELTLKPDRKGKRHLDTMVVAPGLDYEQTMDADTGKITVKFGALFNGETRKVVINMTLLPAVIEEDEEPEEEDVKLAAAELSYKSQGNEDSGKAPRIIQIRRTPHPATAGDSNTFLVLAEVARRRHAESIRAARELADAGKLDAAKDTLMDALNDLENIVLDDGQKMVDTLREELRQLLALMDNEAIYKERGRPYALACETSHGRQRFAAKGDDSRSFATGRMDTHREQATKFLEDPTVPLPSADDDMEDDIAANPMAAVSPELAFYLETAITALQEIHKIITAPAAKRKTTNKRKPRTT